jgi:hypothetical protein
MAPNNPNDPTQPSLLDLIRAMAWASPNLPLSPGLAAPAVNGMQPDSTNRAADPLSASGASPGPWTDIGFTPRLPSYPPAFAGMNPLAGAGQWPAAANAAVAQFNGPPSNPRPSKVSLPYGRPWNGPQAPPLAMSQPSPWSPNVSGFTPPASAPPAFDSRWAGAARPPSLLDMSNVPSPLSEQVPKLSADGTVDPRYVYSYFLNRGFNTAQAAALVGNMMQESYGLKPDAVNPKENAHGFLSWRLDRWPDLQKFAAARGTSPDDVNTQLDFMIHEMRGSEAPHVRRFLLTDNVEDANAALKPYIRYSDLKSEPTRLDNARSVLALPWASAK